jgi:Spx/MgsR family transcriptional regulator
MTITVYGIPNCDTVKKARAWLASHGVEYSFQDGLESAQLARWAAELGWEKLVNRKGTTWRKLDPQTQSGVNDSASAQQLMIQQVSVIRRPVVEWGKDVTVGFDPEAWALRLRGA